MKRIRVLVVDDAVAVRRLVADVLASDPEIEVVGTAASGRIALAKIPIHEPDVVTLDLEMPDLDGLETLRAIRRDHPRLPVIMFSTLTRRGAEATLEALALGATDYVTKPSGEGGAAAALLCVKAELVERIKTFAAPRPEPKEGQASPGAAAAPGRSPRPALAPLAGVEAVAIAVSTGGPNALAAILPDLRDVAVPILVVQHMPPLFTEMLATRLAQRTPLTVAEAVSGRRLEPGHVYLAPGDYHMIVERRDAAVVLRTHQEPPENFCRPAADVLFRSVAQVYGAGALAVVLTGMGQDGLEGSRRVREAGGRILVQDEATSVVWGMPGFVARAGLADDVVPLPRIASEILRRLRAPGAPRPTARAMAAPPILAGPRWR